jgi:hypothetical protein
MLKQNAQHISRGAGRSVLATSYSRTAYRRTTIGAAAFHFRVRNGNGWCHCAKVTRAEKRLRCSALVRNSKFVKSEEVFPIPALRLTFRVAKNNA